MTPAELRALLDQVAAGDVTPGAAASRLTAGPGSHDSGPGYVDVGFARVDTDRRARTGDAEVVFGQGKTAEQVVALLRVLSPDPDPAKTAATASGTDPDPAEPLAGGRAVALATRLAPDALAAVAAAFPTAIVDPVARCAIVGDLPAPVGSVCVVAAGTADEPVAREAAHTVAACGARVVRIADVGVAGIHRLLSVRPALAAADCVVVVAGMDGALPSVVGGLVGIPVVAVPTSVGYGASFGGIAALLTMLNSCAPGVAVCNIDNGFGAGVLAARVARRAGGRPAWTS